MNDYIRINVNISPAVKKIKYTPKWEILYNPLPDWLNKRMLETYKEKIFLFTIYTNNYIYETHERIYNTYGDCAITRYLVSPYLVRDGEEAMVLSQSINKYMKKWEDI